MKRAVIWLFIGLLIFNLGCAHIGGQGKKQVDPAGKRLEDGMLKGAKYGAEATGGAILAILESGEIWGLPLIPFTVAFIPAGVILGGVIGLNWPWIERLKPPVHKLKKIEEGPPIPAEDEQH